MSLLNLSNVHSAASKIYGVSGRGGAGMGGSLSPESLTDVPRKCGRHQILRQASSGDTASPRFQTAEST